MSAKNGTLHKTSGDSSWPVRYRADLVRAGAPDRLTLHGTIDVSEELQSNNVALPAYLHLQDGRWACVYLDREGETSYRIREGSHLIESPPWLNAVTITKGQAISVRCQDCGGELRADERFTSWNRTLGEPEIGVPFWSTTCLGCGHRFNYAPGSGEILRLLSHP